MNPIYINVPTFGLGRTVRRCDDAAVDNGFWFACMRGIRLSGYVAVAECLGRDGAGTIGEETSGRESGVCPEVLGVCEVAQEAIQEVF